MRNLLIAILVSVGVVSYAQIMTIEGYVYTDNDKQYLTGAQAILTYGDKDIDTAYTDITGKFQLEAPGGKFYKLSIFKPGFHPTNLSFNAPADQPVHYIKLPLTRKPGYIFEGTVSDFLHKDSLKVNAIEQATLEIYNVTADSMETIKEPLEGHAFNHLLIPGHQDIMFLRKEGYFSKEIVANVDVEGCILCIDGVGDINPGVADNLTNGNLAGTLSANIQMDSIKVDEGIKIENIYYNLGSDKIRKDAALELDKLVNVLKNNPKIILEIGSHTDSRGDDDSNFNLSFRRARSAMDYLINHDIDKTRLSYRGYGETELVNNCKNGVECTEAKHQQNRRTELKVLGFVKSIAEKSLQDIIDERKFEALIEEVTSGGSKSGSIAEIKKVEGTLVDAETGEKIESKPFVKATEQTGFGFDGVFQIPDDYVPAGADSTDTEETEIEEAIEETDEGIEVEETIETTEEEVQEEIITKMSDTKDESDIVIESTETDELQEEDIEIEVDLDDATNAGLKETLENHNAKMDSIDSLKDTLMASSTDQSYKAELVKNSPVSVNAIANNYSGYAIELLLSKDYLPQGSYLYHRFKDELIIDKEEQGFYAYLLDGFKSEEEAESYLSKNGIRLDYPTSAIIQYKNGLRQ